MDPQAVRKIDIFRTIPRLVETTDSIETVSPNVKEASRDSVPKRYRNNRQHRESDPERPPFGEDHHSAAVSSRIGEGVPYFRKQIRRYEAIGINEN